MRTDPLRDSAAASVSDQYLATEPAFGAGSSDPAIAMLALLVASRGVQSDAARADVRHQHELLREARAKIEESLRQAEQAQKDAGFWGDIAKVLGGDVAAACGLIAAVALTVASGGAGAPAIVALAAAGLTATADIGERLGLDPKVCMALGAAGALVGAVTGNASGAANFWSTLATVGKVAQTTAAGGGITARYASTSFEASAMDARANAKHTQGTQADIWLRIDMALDVLRGAARDLDRSKSTVSNIESEASAGRAAILARMGASA
jgi:hypothetical protein